MEKITILGATGSIGVSTLDVLARHPERYSVYALTTNSRVEKLAEQCRQFRPEIAVVRDAESAKYLSDTLKQEGIKTDVQYGSEALSDVARADECDAVMAAIVGAAGLAPTLAAAYAGKKVMLANKEALVMSGRLFMDAIASNGATLLPIDSEHNAIFQCLPMQFQPSDKNEGIEKILLTASGGPFLRYPLDALAAVTPEQAVKHPKWSMGRKISVDSATMMNKGLEVIEAHWLFGVPSTQIDVVIHPQSVIHSMVSYADGSVLAQMGNPDMRIPIAHALAYPDRISSGVPSLDLTKLSDLHFEQPDFSRFSCLRLAFEALNAGGTAPAVLNAANEVAVQSFLDLEISFDKISHTISHVLEVVDASQEAQNVAQLLEQDHLARIAAQAFISRG